MRRMLLLLFFAHFVPILEKLCYLSGFVRYVYTYTVHIISIYYYGFSGDPQQTPAH